MPVIHPSRPPFAPLVPTRPPLNYCRLLRRGLDADGEAVSLRQQQAVSPGAGQQPSLEVFGKVEGVSDGADGGRVLLEKQLEGGVLKERPPCRDVAALVGASILNLVDAVIREQGSLPPEKRRGALVVVDEMQSMPGVDYESMLSELGKFGASFILATQSLAKLDDLSRTMRDTILANVGCLAIFQVAGSDARQLVWELGKERVTEDDITSLSVHHCYVRATVCYGVQHFRTGCREHTMIRAERLEGLIWGQVKKVMENPDIIVAGIESLDSQEGEGLDEQIAGTERELQKVQFEEDRAIRLYVSEKITEEQLDRQRKFITERLETLRARLADYRAKETAAMEKRALGEHVVEWANRVGDGLDDLPQEKRRDVLRLLLDEVTIDGENNVNLTLAVPTEELVSIGSPVSSSPNKIRPRSR